MSDLPSATQHDLRGAIDRLRIELADRPYSPGSRVIPLLSVVTLADLEAIAAALEAVQS